MLVIKLICSFSAIDICKKPCVDLIFEAGKDSYTVGSPEETSQLSGCKAGEGSLVLHFGQKWRYEKVPLKYPKILKIKFDNPHTSGALHYRVSGSHI